MANERLERTAELFNLHSMAFWYMLGKTARGDTLVKLLLSPDAKRTQIQLFPTFLVRLPLTVSGWGCLAIYGAKRRKFCRTCLNPHASHSSYDPPYFYGKCLTQSLLFRLLFNDLRTCIVGFEPFGAIERTRNRCSVSHGLHEQYYSYYTSARCVTTTAAPDFINWYTCDRHSGWRTRSTGLPPTNVTAITTTAKTSSGSSSTSRGWD